MLKSVLTVLLICVTISSISQKNIPNIVKLNKDTLILSTEVSIEEWMSFIISNNFDESLFPDTNKISNVAKLVFNDLRNRDNFTYLKLKIDDAKSYQYTLRYSNKVISPNRRAIKELLKIDTMYFSLYNPVTGISYEQASTFCKWKEKQINSETKLRVKVSLPSIDLYKMIIENRDSINLKKCALYNSKYCNCLRTDKVNDLKYQGKCLMRVDSYWPNNLGLYNLQGNAAEMTNIKGVAIGGSFRHYAIESLNTKIQEYIEPEDWLGFRYVLTIQ